MGLGFNDLQHASLIVYELPEQQMIYLAFGVVISKLSLN
jgi:hypothetical protein